MLKSRNVKWFFLILVVVLLLWGLNSYSRGKSMENLASNGGAVLGTTYSGAYGRSGSANSRGSSAGRRRGSSSRTRSPKRPAKKSSGKRQGFSEMEDFEEVEGFAGMEEYQPQEQEGFQNYSSVNVANPKDLLPVDQNSQWSALNPVQNKYPQMPDMLQAGNLIGLDTIGQTLKNANYQLRSDPIIPKGNVGPWNNSTYEPDYARVPLELGNGQP